MTKVIRFENRFSPFGRWVNEHPDLDSRKWGLSVQNLDYIVHRYNFPSCQAIMLIEEKQYGGKQDFAQRDTHQILHQALRYAEGKPIVTARGKIMPLRYIGYHILTFEKTTPDDGRMWWNGAEISVVQLLKIMRFMVDPRTIGKAA